MVFCCRRCFSIFGQNSIVTPQVLPPRWYEVLLQKPTHYILGLKTLYMCKWANHKTNHTKHRRGFFLFLHMHSTRLCVLQVRMNISTNSFSVYFCSDHFLSHCWLCMSARNQVRSSFKFEAARVCGVSMTFWRNVCLCVCVYARSNGHVPDKQTNNDTKETTSLWFDAHSRARWTMWATVPVWPFPQLCAPNKVSGFVSNYFSPVTIHHLNECRIEFCVWYARWQL